MEEPVPMTPLVVPSPSCSVPPLMVTAPLKLLTPVKIRVPVPALVRVPLPPIELEEVWLPTTL